MLQGLIMDMPLMISSAIQHAAIADVNPDFPVTLAAEGQSVDLGP